MERIVTRTIDVEASVILKLFDGTKNIKIRTNRLLISSKTEIIPLLRDYFQSTIFWFRALR